jgi:hypothetical protein
MRVVVVLDTRTAQEMQFPSRGAADEAVNRGMADLHSTEGDLGVKLTPMYPGQNHPTLLPFFFVDVPDQAAAERVVARLSQLAAVEAAYTQPGAEPPGSP